MLFKLIVNGFSTEINDDLEALLDEITPLYKARYEEISEQSQKIIATIALNWDAISLKKLSQQSGYANNQLSPQLKRLIEEGWIETTPAEKAKGNAYYISERFFNIWFIMRMSTRRKKQEIIFLSRFLESFYGEEIHNMALKLSRKRRFIDLNQISCSFALAESKKVQLKTRRKLKEKATEALFEFAKENPKILEQYDISEDYLKKINKLTLGEIMNNCNGVLDKLELLQSANPNDIKLLLFMGELYQNIDLLDKAEMQYEKTLEIDKNNATAWYELGNIYAMKEKYTDAIRYLEKANELKPNEFWYLANLAGLYYEAKIYEKAESAYKQLVEKNMNDSYAWHMLGNVCVTTKEYKEAELAYKKSILLKDSIFSKYDLMVLYRDNLNKLEEAESLFSTIYIELQQDEILYLLNQSLFNLYKQDLGQAKDKFHEISSFIKDDCPYFTKYTGGNDDEWCRYAAIVINLNYGSWFLQILEEKGYDISLSPYYTAIKALEIEKQDSKNGKKNAEIYLKNRAIEISEPARMIMEKIRKYM
jgi:tetratricopeptide (TPR) repeat protein